MKEVAGFKHGRADEYATSDGGGPGVTSAISFFYAENPAEVFDTAISLLRERLHARETIHSNPFDLPLHNKKDPRCKLHLDPFRVPIYLRPTVA